MKKNKPACYHNDYAPRYQEAYDIYEKARQHMKKISRLKKEDGSACDHKQSEGSGRKK